MTGRFRAVIHVGAHKTGSSLIQKFLRDNRAALAHNGVYSIPRSDMNTLAGWGKPLHQTPHLLRDRLSAAAAEQYDVAIASHENTIGRPLIKGTPGLYPNAPRHMKALSEVLDGFDYRVVVYVRPQADFVESYYLQHLHEGGTQTFRKWFDELVDIRALSWRPLVESMQQAFGPDRVVVGDFSQIRHGQDQFLRQFFRSIDVDPGLPLTYAPLRNPSVSDKGMRMALAVNPLVTTPRQRKAVRVFLQKHFSNRQYPRPVLLSAEERERIEELYGKEYQTWFAA